MPDNEIPSDPAADPAPFDTRLYVVSPDGWTAHVKQGWEKEYCHAQNPGDDFFHLLINGELYLQRGNEKFCITCALRNGALTRKRLHWKHADSEFE